METINLYQKRLRGTGKREILSVVLWLKDLRVSHEEEPYIGFT